MITKNNKCITLVYNLNYDIRDFSWLPDYYSTSRRDNVLFVLLDDSERDSFGKRVVVAINDGVKPVDSNLFLRLKSPNDCE